MSLPDIETVSAERIPALTKARIAIYGRNGVGKTTFASTIPPHLKVAFVSADDENIRPVAHLPNFAIFKARRWNGLQRLLSVLWDRQNQGKGFDVLVFDTWSRMQDLALGKVCNYEPIDPVSQQQYIDRIPRSPKGWEGWGQVGYLCSEWQRYFNRLPLHILYLLQENDREMADKSIQTGPRLTPQALLGIRDCAEILGRLYVTTEGAHADTEEVALDLTPKDVIDPSRKEVRRLFIGQHDRFLAKGPTHLLGRVIEDPTWSKIVDPLLSPSDSPPNGTVGRPR